MGTALSAMKQIVKRQPILRALIYSPYRALICSPYHWLRTELPAKWRRFRDTRAFYSQLRRAERSRLAGIREQMQLRWKGMEYWHIRIRDVMECPDNNLIPRHPLAGRIVDGCLIMHNGLRIVPGSYYGEPVKEMLIRNSGVHEPQEERVFAAVLPHMPPGAVMMELGAYWAFYSMWFASRVRDARCFMVEPNAEFLERGRENFALNGLSGSFHHAYAGASTGTAPDGVPTIGVDDFAAQHGLDFIHLLHSDIQHHELDMLRGAQRMLQEHRVGHWFISTHTNQLHRQCERVLCEHGYRIIASVDCDASYSVDGVLVARAPDVPGPEPLELSRAARRPRRERELLRFFADQK